MARLHILFKNNIIDADLCLGLNLNLNLQLESTKDINKNEISNMNTALKNLVQTIKNLKSVLYGTVYEDDWPKSILTKNDEWNKWTKQLLLVDNSIKTIKDYLAKYNM